MMKGRSLSVARTLGRGTVPRVLAGLIGVVFLAGAVDASELGDLIQERGFVLVADEVGTTGRVSSYHGKEMGHRVYDRLPEFGEERVRFPNGRTPSPGGRVGRYFDEGVLGYRLDRAAGTISFVVGCGVNARDWLAVSSLGNALYGQGDLFLDVRDAGDKVHHLVLLNDMQGRRPLGHRGWWDAARSFRHTGSVSVGELVALRSEDDIQLCGGQSGYRRGRNSPFGLDERTFAKGGEPVGVGEIRFDHLEAAQPLGNGKPITWYLTEWTVPLESLGPDVTEIALHIATTCGNDQIGGTIKLDGSGERAKPKKKLIH